MRRVEMRREEMRREEMRRDEMRREEMRGEESSVDYVYSSTVLSDSVSYCSFFSYSYLFLIFMYVRIHF